MVSTRTNHKSLAFVAVTFSNFIGDVMFENYYLSSIDAATLAVPSLHARRKLRP